MANDWYTLLQLPRDATTEQITEAVEKRSRQAAALANTAPERSQQLREQIRSIKRDLLSGDEARAQYNASLAGHGGAAAAAPPEALPAPEQYSGAHADQAYQQPGGPRTARGNRFVRFLQTGWTCWHCGESALPTDKFCTQCRAQLGADATYVPITTPPANPNACPYCGTVAALNHRFCRICGASRG